MCRAGFGVSMDILLVVVGLLALVVGGDLLVRGAVQAAERAKVSPLLIGLTLVGFGTSLPELVTSLQAALADAPGIAVGNVIGSNSANILLILGVAAVLWPVAVDGKTLRRDGTVLILASLAGLGVVLMGAVDRMIGSAFLVLILAYVIVSYRLERQVATPDRGDHPAAPAPVDALALARPRLHPLLLVAGGLALTVLGARLLVDGAIAIARDFGISETVIGLTLVAVGTSLPELVTSVIAAVRRESDIAFGNIVGSNIFNLLFILGATAIVTPLPIPRQITSLDIWVMLAATAALILFSLTGRQVSRAEGAVLLVGYVAYMGVLAYQARLPV